MLHLLFPNPSTQKNLTANSLGPFIQSYANSLYADGFKQSTMKQLVRIASHFGYWIDMKGISVQSIDSQILQLFLDHLWACCK